MPIPVIPAPIIGTLLSGYQFEENLGANSTDKWMKDWSSRKRREFLNQLEASNRQLQQKLRFLRNELERVR